MFFLSLNDVLLLASSSSQHTAAPTDPQLFPAPRKHFLLLPAETFKHWQIRPLPRPPPELSPAGRKNSKPRRRQRFTDLKREKSENRSGLKQTCLLCFWVLCRSPPRRQCSRALKPSSTVPVDQKAIPAIPVDFRGLFCNFWIVFDFFILYFLWKYKNVFLYLFWDLIYFEI